MASSISGYSQVLLVQGTGIIWRIWLWAYRTVRRLFVLKKLGWRQVITPGVKSAIENFKLKKRSKVRGLSGTNGQPENPRELGSEDKWENSLPGGQISICKSTEAWNYLFKIPTPCSSPASDPTHPLFFIRCFYVSSSKRSRFLISGKFPVYLMKECLFLFFLCLTPSFVISSFTFFFFLRVRGRERQKRERES